MKESTIASEVKRVSDGFEEGFLDRTIEEQMAHCEEYALTPLFLEILRDHQPVLEAGCGGGQWMHYFKRQGIEATGLDWSPVLRERSLAFDPTVPFDNGDLRELPYPDGSFGSLIAMGSPEHVIEGPRTIFKEFYRVLRPGGVAIVTVPYFSRFRSLVYRYWSEPLRRLKRNSLLRRLAGKQPVKRSNPESYRSTLNKRYRRDVYLEVDFDGFFYEYQFTKKVICEELEHAGFAVKKCFSFGAEGGIYATIGRPAGKYDRRTRQFRMSLLGKLLYWVLGEAGAGHMICTVVQKSD